MSTIRVVRGVVAVAALALLASCGGGGGGSSTQRQTPPPPPTPTITSVAVSCNPATLQLAASGTQPTALCSANVQGTGSFSAAVQWTSTAGTVSASGVLTPPSAAAQTVATVTATSVGDPTKSGSATVTVNPPPVSQPVLGSIPSVTLAGLGQKAAPTDLSQYVTGGTAPFTYSLVGQTDPSVANCGVSGTAFSCDYDYHPGTNTATVKVVDANGLAAQATITVTATVPAVAYKVMFDVSPYEAGQDPNTGADVSEDQLVQRFGMAVPYASAFRSFGCTHGQDKVAEVAARFGVPLYLGVWIGKDAGANATEIANCIAAAQANPVQAVIVGSEVTLRGDVTPTQLVGYMNQVRTALPGVPVATADVWGELLNNPDIVNASDFVFVNYYPYWEKVDAANAIAVMNGEDIQLAKAYPGKEIIVSETGWPSCGNPQGSAVPSPDNAAAYFETIASWAQAGHRKVFYFEFFDEAWKAAYEGPQGRCWGVFDENGLIKAGMQDTFDGKTVPDTWTCASPPGGSGTPTLTFTSVPAMGSSAPLLEQVMHVVPKDYYIAVYIHLSGFGWWVKPYANQPETLIACDGTASTAVVTGGIDGQADEITAFLLPNSYAPPILLGSQSLPADLTANAVATADAKRP
ncbi:MAG TPA: glycosyl hydrolase family 17 protein [Candidatus Paceibacterota bacterium]|nr:glycosyl hydrolase family 17 protein [Candidatus Paceibacterota bacterium]